MVTGNNGLVFKSGPPSNQELIKAERDLNEIIPILAHGLVRRLELKGHAGRVRVHARAGDTWGVAKSSDNNTDIPNVIIYPRSAISGDKKLTNARLRHEIGNLNYPNVADLNALREWCAEERIAPELLTSIVEAVHEASVNQLEMRNSHSSTPEDNFKTLYEQEINTLKIASTIGQSAPYKQAIDLTLLYSLARVNLIPHSHFEQGLSAAAPEVRAVFDKACRSVLDQAIKVMPKQQIQLIKEYVWPKFSKLIALSGPALTEGTGAEVPDKKAEKSLEFSARAQQAKELQERIQQMMKKMSQESHKQQTSKKAPQEQKRGDQKESQKRPEQKLSKAEQRERKEEENLLAQNLQEQLEKAKEQMEKLGQQTPESPKPQKKPASMEDIGKQAEQMKQEAQKALQEAKEAGAQDEITKEQLEELQKKLEQLEKVAKQVAGEDVEEQEDVPEEPFNYNIKEVGIDESSLTLEQLAQLQKIRSFAQTTSQSYRAAMRLVMRAYQVQNPKFTEKMLQQMMRRGHDVPDFTIYGPKASQEFVSQRTELGTATMDGDFLVNFQLPKPMARYWYRGGGGTKSLPVEDGEIEWGHFYRATMPVIYSSVDRVAAKGLFLNRVNKFGQHDPKKYYYLWEAINLAENQEDNLLKTMQEQLQQMKEQLDEMDDQSESKDRKKSEQAKSESSEKRSEKSDQQKQSGQEQSSPQSEKTPSAEQLKKEIDELREQVDQMIQDAMENGDQDKADQLQEMKDQLDQMAEQLEKAEQGEDGESGEQGEGQESGKGQEGSESQGQESGESGSESGQGEGQGEGGEGAGESGQQGSQGGQPDGKGGQKGQGAGQPGGMESGSGGMPSAQEMQEFLSQMQDMLNQAKEQGGQGGAPGASQVAIDRMLKQLAQMQQSLESGASPQDMTGQMQHAMQQLSEVMSEMQDEGQGEGQGLSGEQSGESSDQSGESDGQAGEQSHDQFSKGGETHNANPESLFSSPNPELLKELRMAEGILRSKFTTQDFSGNAVENRLEDIDLAASYDQEEVSRKIEALGAIKRRQEAGMLSVYREMSGLDGDALRVFSQYMEDTRSFQDDLKEFFIRKFKLDKEYIYTRNNPRGARLQRGFMLNILGQRGSSITIDPRSFERKNAPKKPNIVWSIIIDNSGSCSGEIIEQQKMVAVALVQVAQDLGIPIEIVTFGGPNQFTFLKTFEQDLIGEDLQKLVLLHADQDTPDVPTLEGASISMARFVGRFKKAYPFGFFMTDGQSGSGSIQEVLNRHRKVMTWTGIGMAGAARTIKQTWGENAVAVPDVKMLATAVIRKIEDQMDETFY